MKDLYNTIIERLTSEQAKEAYRAKGIPSLKYIDWYRGQYFNFEAHDLLPVPGLLFEFTIAYDDNEGLANVNLHLLYEQARDTSNISVSKEKALRFFDFISVTHTLLEELSSPNTGKLKLISEETLKDDAVVSVYLLSYQTAYTGRNTEKFIYTRGEDLQNTGRIKEFF